MRVATYNIRHGAPAGSWARHRAMGRSVAGLRADVVALQEVDRRVVRSWFVDQAASAGRRSGCTAHFASARSLGPGGRYGNALLVRGRTMRTHTLRLPGDGEPRVALLARVVLGDDELTVVSTHLQNRPPGRPVEAPRQLDALLEELARWPEPWCLMGDLNLRADTVLPRLASAGLAAAPAAPTFPADRPRLAIDWIAVRGLEVGRVEVPDLRTSDHRPVLATLGRHRSGFPQSGAVPADTSDGTDPQAPS